MRSAIILIDADRVALIERRRDGQVYYVFPGGKVERAESRESAARRETMEELGLEVRIGRLAAIVDTLDRKQYYYLATAIGGQFGAGTGAEMASDAASARGSFTPVWIWVDELPNHDVRPRSVAALIAERRLADTAEVFVLRD